MRCSFRIIRKSILRHIYRKWQDQDLLFVNLCTFLYIQKYETEEKIVFRILSFSHCKHFLYPEFQYLVLKNFHSNTTLTFLNLRLGIIKCIKKQRMVNIHSTLISIVYNVSNNIFPLSVSCPSIISDNPQSTSMALFKTLVLNQQNIFKKKLRVKLIHLLNIY